MADLLERTQPATEATPAGPASGVGKGASARTEALAREDLRGQIATLERRLSETFVAAFPGSGIDWRVGAAGGPRVLALRDLERVRDALAFRLREAEAELARRAEAAAESRDLLEEMVAAPERHRWIRISNRHLGEPGCRHWHSRPRLGPVGILLNWWRVKVSSGCPLAIAGAFPRGD